MAVTERIVTACRHLGSYEWKQDGKMLKVLIITGGWIDPGFAGAYLEGKEYDRIIAADAGLSSCDLLGVTPTDILGDFDSLDDRDLLNRYKDMGVFVQSFPTRKDYTDTHLALGYAVKLCPEDITLLGATGTRYDHALANIGLLQWVADQGICCRIVDPHNEMEMLHGPVIRHYEKRSDLPWFSLLAWGGSASGIDLEGFSYPLHHGMLTTDVSLGISNELTKETGTIKLQSGYLLVIRSVD